MRVSNILKIIGANIVVLAVLLVASEYLGRSLLHYTSVDFLRYINSDLRVQLLPDMKDVFPQLTFSRTYKPDESLAWTLIPNRKHRRKNEDGEKWVSITSKYGFITPSLPTNNEPQIITIGDSFLEGKRNPVPIPKVIENHTDLPVFNMAVGGWGPFSYVAAFNKYAADRNAKVVVVFSVFNDANDATKYSRWKREFGNLTYEDFLNADRWRHASGNNGTAWLDESSVIYNGVKYIFTKILPKKKRAKRIEESLKLKDGTQTKMYFRNDLEYISCKSGQLYKGGACFEPFSDYFMAMDRLHAAISKSGNKMVLIWIPSKERVYFDFLDAEFQEKYLDETSETLFDVEQVIDWYAKDRGITFLDLTPMMIDHAKSGRELYFKYDNHLNKNGTVVAGTAAVKFLRENGFIN